VERVLSFKKDHPAWWEYGTMPVNFSVVEHEELYCVNDLKKIIPVTGKNAALKAMSSLDEITSIAKSGAWTIHFEMQSSTELL
jgi:hypothetical protein